MMNKGSLRLRTRDKLSTALKTELAQVSVRRMYDGPDGKDYNSFTLVYSCLMLYLGRSAYVVHYTLGCKIVNVHTLKPW